MLSKKFDFGLLKYIFNNLINYKKEEKRLLVQYVYSAIRCWIDKKSLGKFKDNDMKVTNSIILSFSDLHKKFIARIKSMQRKSIDAGKQYFSNEMYDYLSSIKVTLFRNIINTLKDLHLINIKSDKSNGNMYTLNNVKDTFQALKNDGYIIAPEILKTLNIDFKEVEISSDEFNISNYNYDKLMEKAYKKNENVQTEKCISDLETSEVAELESSSKYSISNSSISNISISNTSKLVVHDKEKKNILVDMFEDQCKAFRDDMKIKYNIAIRLTTDLKEKVLNKIQNNLFDIDLKGAAQYIYTVIVDIYTKAFNKRFEANKRFFDCIKRQNKRRSGDFEQRNYDFKDLEYKLLGWDITE